MSQTKVKSGLIDFTEGIDSFIEFSGGNSTVTGDLTVSGTLTGYTPTSGLNTSNWNTAYSYSQVGHLPLTGGTLTGQLTTSDTGTSSSIVITSDSIGNGAIDLTKNTNGTGIRITNNGVGSGIVTFNNSTGTGITIANTSTGKGLLIDNSSSTTGDPFVYTLGGAAYVKAKINYLGNLTLAGTITASGYNNSNWDTAYGWGNHASAGYLTSFDITTQTDSKYLRSDESDTMSGSLTANGVSSIGQEQAFTWQRTTSVASDVYSLNADSGSAYLYNNTTSDVLMLWSEGGRVLINTTTDIGDPFYLQVDGRIMQTGAEFLFSGDQDKMITVYNNRPLYLRTNDTTRVTILGGGDVGIGSTSIFHSAKLAVAGKVHFQYSSNTDIGGAIYSTHTQGANSSDYYAGDLRFQNFDASSGTYGLVDRMIIDGRGYVGIGTMTPSQKLHINGSSAGLNFTGGNNRIYFNSYRAIEGAQDGSALQLGEGYTQTFLQSSKVGIGTTLPETKLHVVGTDNSGSRTTPINVLTITGENGNSPYDGFGGTILFKNRIYEGGPSPGGIREGARITTRINTNSGVNYGTDLIFENTATGDGALQPVMALRFNGAVAIGTLDPSDYKLRVLSSGSTGIRIDTAGSTFGSPSINARNGSVDTVISATSNGLEIGTWSSNDIIFKRAQSERARITANGLTFNGDTAAANALDDYEEGTWTPTLGGTWTVNPTSLSGTYIKIGNIVIVRFTFIGGTKSSATAGWIDGLPYSGAVGGSGTVSSVEVDNAGIVLLDNNTRLWLTQNSFNNYQYKVTATYII